MIRKTLASAGVFVLLAGGITFAAVQSASAAPVKPKQVGACASKTTGALRLLEPNRLAKSQYGKCRSTEKKVPLPTTYAPVKVVELPAKFQVKFGTTVAVCTKGADVPATATVAAFPAYECV